MVGYIRFGWLLGRSWKEQLIASSHQPAAWI
jgi:hypothetical protein